jgi:type II secretory pathway pseudopilin PulG
VHRGFGLKALPAALRREESGFQLIELVLAAALLAVALGAVLALLDVTAQEAPRHTERGQAIREAETGLERMTREIRQASTVTINSSRSVDLRTWVRVGGGTAIERTVRFDCSTDKCLRSEGPVGGGLTGGEVLVSGVSNSDIFTPTPSSGTPTYLAVKLALNVERNDKPYYVYDGAEMRNAP